MKSIGKSVGLVFMALLFMANPLIASDDDSLDENDLVGHWTFNDGSGLIADDSSGYSMTGNLMAATGGDLPSWILDGIDGTALHFDGTDYVTIPESGSAYDFGLSGFSLAAWVRYATLGAAEYMIVGKHSAGYTNGYFLDVGHNWDPIGNANRLDFFSDDATHILSKELYDDQQ